MFKDQSLDYEEEAKQLINHVLTPNEMLIEFVWVSYGEMFFQSLIALTSRRLILIDITGEEFIASDTPIANVALLKWSGLWAMLKLRLKSPEKTTDFAVSGKLWKAHAKNMAEQFANLKNELIL